MSAIRPARAATALLVGLALLAGCERPATSAQPPAPTPEPTLQPDDRVDLTVYLRNGSTDHLTPVVREVAVTENLPRRALELLIAGPTPEEADSLGLAPALPTTTDVLGFVVEGHTARVDLSAHVIRDARSIGASPEGEFLALAALSGTLTEFPAIDRVQLTVEGASTGWRGGVDVGGFWGGWGLPEVLVRDETVLGQPSREGEGVPDLAQFSTAAQEVGPAGVEPVAVSTVRTRGRTTYLRLAIEIVDPQDPDASGPTPRTRARAVDNQIVVEVDGVTAYADEVTGSQRRVADDPLFQSLAVEVTELPGTVRFRLTLREAAPFVLRSLSSPTRIILDVKK